METNFRPLIISNWPVTEHILCPPVCIREWEKWTSDAAPHCADVANGDGASAAAAAAGDQTRLWITKSASAHAPSAPFTVYSQWGE